LIALQNVYDEIEMVCIYVYQILLIYNCYATENKDASHK